jgi:quercetin dioxygenase-like cupin family protein
MLPVSSLEHDRKEGWLTMRIRGRLAVGWAAAFWLPLAGPAFLEAQQPAAALKNQRPILENELVRVGQVVVEAGQSEGVHVHPYPRVLICLEGAPIQVRRKDGSTEQTIYRAGDARYQSNRDPHEPMNVSKTRFSGVVVELKGPETVGSVGVKPVARGEKSPDPLDPLVAAPGFHRLVVENERIRVLDVQVAPGQFEPMHRHRQSLIVVLQGGKARFQLPDSSLQELSFDAAPSGGGSAAQQVFWTGPETHSVNNIGNTTIRLIRVEVK